MKAIALLIISLCFISCDQNSRDKEISIFPRDEASRLYHDKEARTIATIDYRWSACFGVDACKITIVSSKGGISALLKTREASYTTMLDNYKMQAYNRFLSELDELKTTEPDLGCTTQQFYSVQIGTKKVEKSEGSCSWNGFTVLRRSLFPAEKYPKLITSLP